MNVAPGSTFEWLINGFATGIGSVGTAALGVRIRDGAGANFLARRTTSIVEDVTVGTSAVYRTTFTAPTVSGQFWLIADNGSSTVTEELIVTSSTAAIVTSDLYITREEVKTAANLSSLDYADDDIDRACSAVSRALDEVCRGRTSHFYQATETRYYTPGAFNCTYGPYETRLEIDDLTSASSVTVDVAGDGSYSTTWVEGTDFYLEPRNAAVNGWPYEELVLRRANGTTFPDVQHAVKITGTYGWPSVPIQVSQYALIYTTQMVIRTRQAPLGILTASLESGGGVRISRMDPDFDRMCGQFTRQKLFI